jgi:hypothetical protein
VSRVIIAEYDAERQVLKLPEPLEGVKDRERVRLAIERPSARPQRPWMRHRGVLDEESGREIAVAIREAFGEESIEV